MEKFALNPAINPHSVTAPGVITIASYDIFNAIFIDWCLLDSVWSQTSLHLFLIRSNVSFGSSIKEAVNTIVNGWFSIFLRRVSNADISTLDIWFIYFPLLSNNSVNKYFPSSGFKISTEKSYQPVGAFIWLETKTLYPLHTSVLTNSQTHRNSSLPIVLTWKSSQLSKKNAS